MNKELNAAEAVYGFVGWLTSREERTVMSAKDDCAPIAELIKRFCTENNLPEVSDQWPLNLIHPSGEVAVPNAGVTGPCAGERLEMSHEPMPAQGPVDANVSRLPACKGTNCGCTDGRSHSPECVAEYEECTKLPYDEKYLHHPDTGTGWKCYVCGYGGAANNYANTFCVNCHCHR